VPVHTIHRPFFSPAEEPQDPRLGVAKDATHRGLWTEAGKPKRIIEPAWFLHPRIMTDYSPWQEGEKTYKSSEFEAFTRENHPLGWEKSQ
jgi:hypothetical protein